jgi:hypothetical protein
LFLGVGTAMNLSFAWTMAGSSNYARAVYVAISLGTAFLIAFMPGVIHENHRKGSRRGVAVATALFLAGLGYDSYTALMFSKQQLSASKTTASESSRLRSAAEATVKRATNSLKTYEAAPDATVAKSEAGALKAQIQVIDRVPGVVWKGVPCTRQRDAEVVRYCEQRGIVEAELQAANIRVAQAEAKARLQLELETAQRQLNSLPTTISDPRTELFAEGVAEWLPVVLLVLGAMSLLAVPPEGSKFDATGQPSDQQASEAPPASNAPQRRAKGQKGRAAVAARLTELAESPPKGIVIDRDGHIRGSQRILARSLGYGSNVGRFNRDLHEAVEAGDVQLDTSNGTAIRVKEPV